MLVIKPIQDKEFQKQVVENCHGTYDAASFAYIANECEEDGETIRHPIGGCQFAIRGESGEISLLRCVPGVEDEEAMMIMTRAATSFLFRCGIRYVNMLPDAAEAALIRKLGFVETESGVPVLDLYRYYTMPCSEREHLNQ